jgi:Periplasmic binding protein-like domain
VVGDDVDDDPDAERVRFRDQGVGVGEGAEDRVDRPVVGYVVACVEHRRGIPGVDPDRVHGTNGSAWCSGPEDHMPSRRKLAASREHAGRAGFTVAPVEHTLFSLEGGQAATTQILRQGVTGVICGSDVLALGAIRAVRRAGMSVPGDVSVVGFDDSGWLNCTDPPLTTVRQPIESMGKAAVALLVNQMETVMANPEELLFEPELVVRGSTGPAPVRAHAQVPAVG